MTVVDVVTGEVLDPEDLIPYKLIRSFGGYDLILDSQGIERTVQSPLPTKDLIYKSFEYNSDFTLLLDKSGKGNDAKIIASNCVQYNGTSSKSVIQFDNYCTFISDRISITYSTNGGTSFQTWKTGDVAVSGLVQVDSANKRINIGFDGTNYFNGIITKITIEYLSNSVYTKWFECNFSSGYTVKDWNIMNNEGQWVTRQFPFDLINNNMPIDNNLFI